MMKHVCVRSHIGTGSTETVLFTVKGAASCFPACACVFSIHVDCSGGTSAVFIVGAVSCLAVDLYGLTAALSLIAVLGGRGPFPEASAACLVRKTCVFAHHIDLSSGTELIFVIDTGCRIAFQYCHGFALLFVIREYYAHKK